jgi:phenylalanyl-tRNA synthetase beta chain
MKASYRWLRALVPGLTASPAELAARFTAAGLEVEALHAYGEASASCVIAKVLGKRPHPTKSGLTLVEVDRDGTSAAVPQRGPGQAPGQDRLEVVCGAPNVPEPGGLVVLAPLGAKLPAKGVTDGTSPASPERGHIVIERRTIAGTVSEGMLCSESELGLTDSGEGILVLPEGTGTPGTALAIAVPASCDTILEIGLTPNRPDGLGHLGLAREAAALYGLAWAVPGPDAPGRAVQGKIESYLDVVVEDPERCPHYGAAVVVDVKVGPSPLWLRYRLSALGVRPISNVVDVTNLVLLEYGHPMHAFDLDLVRGGRILVRRAGGGEKLTTLDGVTRSLSEDDLVIADGEGPVALAGVMGGASSEIRPTTTRVALECAYFEPRGVRRASRRHALHTESSHRFERGVDPGDIPEALTHAASLLTHLAGGSAVPGALHRMAPAAPRVVVRLRAARMNQLLGTDVPFPEALGILSRLGCTTVPSGDGAADVTVPTHRPDVSREVDLIEEVARVRGYDAIPTSLPRVRRSVDEAPRELLLRRARAAGVELGLSEAVTYAFVSRKELADARAPEPRVVLKNPLSATQEVMRTSLLPGLLAAIATAGRHGARDSRLFTLGPVFLGEDAASTDAVPAPLPIEPLVFAAALSGERPAYLARPAPVDVWDGKGIAEGIVQRLTGRSAEVRAFAANARPPHLHPRGAALVSIGGARVGSLGPLHPDVADRFDLKHEVILVELDLDAIGRLGKTRPRFVPIPRFPASTRDLALVVSDDVPAGEVEGAVKKAAGPMAEEVTLFDRFSGGAIPPGHTSLAFRIVYRAEGRTLTDAEVDLQHGRVVADVGALFGATLRA